VSSRREDEGIQRYFESETTQGPHKNRKNGLLFNFVVSSRREDEGIQRYFESEATQKSLKIKKQKAGRI